MKYQEQRSIGTVARRILEVIPTSEDKLYNELYKFTENLIYNAPEIRNDYFFWQKMIFILNKHIKEVKYDWQIEIKNIIISE